MHMLIWYTGPIPNNNPDWLPTRKLNRNGTYTVHMLNTDTGQQASIASGARGMSCKADAEQMLIMCSP